MMLVLVPFYVRIAETKGRTFDGHITLWCWIIAALGMWSALGGYSVRRKMLALANAEANNGKEVVARRQWSAAQLAGLMSAHSVVLWGIVARMGAGCPRWYSITLYMTGAVLLIAWKLSIEPIPAQL